MAGPRLERGRAPLLKDETDKINYSVGYQIGGDFKKQQLILSREALARGLKTPWTRRPSPCCRPRRWQTLWSS